MWAVTNCTSLGYQCYLPTFTAQIRDRVVKTIFHAVESPLFTRYAFVALAHGEPWTPIRYAGGVKSLLMMDGKPAYASTASVEALQATEASRRTLTHPNALWQRGDACSLNSGPFQGLDAVIESVDLSSENAKVGVIMLGGLRTITVLTSYLMQR